MYTANTYNQRWITIQVLFHCTDVGGILQHFPFESCIQMYEKKTLSFECLNKSFLVVSMCARYLAVFRWFRCSFCLSLSCSLSSYSDSYDHSLLSYSLYRFGWFAFVCILSIGCCAYLFVCMCVCSAGIWSKLLVFGKYALWNLVRSIFLSSGSMMSSNTCL